MLPAWGILLASFAYLGILFAIAYYGDRRADAGASIINSPTVYALSLAVYATSWTFYGSVGRAAASGIGFLPIYLGPTLMAALWWMVLRKIIRISKANRITSIADFIAARYGKSALLGGLVTVVAVIGVIPYIALQLKAVSGSVAVLLAPPQATAAAVLSGPLWSDATLYIALLLALFTILFGTRHLDAAERHEGMVAAIAFESLVKLAAFVAVGVFVTFGMYDGFGDLFARVRAYPQLQSLLTLGDGSVSFGSWASLIVLSMLSILLLPRQFQIAVVENVDENHVRRAVWLLPLYLLAINVFVLPIAFAGLMHAPQSGGDPDAFVLTLPLLGQRHGLALLVYLGGLSAATGMVIVETIALSTMVCNNLVLPLLLRAAPLQLKRHADLSGLLLQVRRGAIVLLMLLGYGYFRLAGEASALVSIGLISFAAVAQFAPALLGGIFWKDGTLRGALAGLGAGFALWLYTLLLPSFSHSGWLPAGLIEHGPFGVELLRPLQLFGLSGMDPVAHALFWTLLANFGLYIGISLAGRQSGAERTQAMLFVDALRSPAGSAGPHLWHGTASGGALRGLLRRFLGNARADDALARFDRQYTAAARPASDGELAQFVEIQLAGAIGAVSARTMIASLINEKPPAPDEMLAMLDETSQIIVYSRELERKSRELETASAELKAANARLTELDQLKDQFVSTVSHELRTPLTSILAFSEILRDHPQLAEAERNKYLDIIISQSERLTRLINDMLDLAKIESGSVEWRMEPVDLRRAIGDAVTAVSALVREKGIALELRLPPRVPPVIADHDRLVQVMVNLLSNAVKFCDRQHGLITVGLDIGAERLQVGVRDNGAGVRAQDRELIFQKFRQGGDPLTGKPQGTGLGLPISREIIEHFGGTLELQESSPGEGAWFTFTLPRAHHMETSDEPQNTDR